MSLIQAIILGIAQGLTEFFPISSSVHLKLLKSILQIKETQDIFFDLACHLGTACALIFYLRKRIISLFKEEKEKSIYLFIAMLPLVLSYFFLKPARVFLSSEHFAGIFLIITAILLFIASSMRDPVSEPVKSKKHKILDSLLIGLLQSIALIPGVSRSGVTIFGGCARGWQLKDAVLFSFLLSVPTILGGSFLEALKIEQFEPDRLGNYFAAFFTSFSIGLLTVRFIFSLKSNRGLRPFAIYCLLIGFFLLLYFNI